MWTSLLSNAILDTALCKISLTNPFAPFEIGLFVWMAQPRGQFQSCEVALLYVVFKKCALQVESLGVSTVIVY